MTSPLDGRAAALAEIRARITDLQAQLDALPAGVQSVSIDGTSSSFSRKPILDEIDYWNRRLSALAGRRERISNIRLDNAF
jgi:hypothetical protein